MNGFNHLLDVQRKTLAFLWVKLWYSSEVGKLTAFLEYRILHRLLGYLLNQVVELDLRILRQLIFEHLASLYQVLQLDGGLGVWQEGSLEWSWVYVLVEVNGTHWFVLTLLDQHVLKGIWLQFGQVDFIYLWAVPRVAMIVAFLRLLAWEEATFYLDWARTTNTVFEVLFALVTMILRREVLHFFHVVDAGLVKPSIANRLVLWQVHLFDSGVNANASEAEVVRKKLHNLLILVRVVLRWRWDRLVLYYHLLHSRDAWLNWVVQLQNVAFLRLAIIWLFSEVLIIESSNMVFLNLLDLLKLVFYAFDRNPLRETFDELLVSGCLRTEG